MEAYNEFSERFLKVIDELHISDYSIWNNVNGITKEQISKIRRGVGGASLNIIRDFCSHYNKANVDYILTGRGKPILYEDASEFGKDLIPLYKSEAAAGFGLTSIHVSDNDIEGYYRIKDFFKASFMLRVRGKSMEPLYNSGDIVAVRIVNDVRFIEWGKPYLIGTNSMGLLLKRLNPSDDDDYVLAVSENKENFPPFKIPKDDINGIALVLGVVRVDNW